MYAVYFFHCLPCAGFNVWEKERFAEFYLTGRGAVLRQHLGSTLDTFNPLDPIYEETDKDVAEQRRILDDFLYPGAGCSSSLPRHALGQMWYWCNEIASHPRSGGTR